MTVRYPRGAQAEKQLHAEALDALKRARTPEAALAIVLRLLVLKARHEPCAKRRGILEGVWELLD